MILHGSLLLSLKYIGMGVYIGDIWSMPLCTKVFC